MHGGQHPAPPRPILDVAADLQLPPELVDLHGPFRAKISLDAIEAAAGPPGRYVLVSAVTPTGAGEGKTVSSISLAMGLAKRGHRVAAALRQSSLGPTLGAKGGGAGGGLARIEPLDECLLGLGHDLFAVESANNLLAAVVDDALQRNLIDMPTTSITWRRVVDVDDRALRHVVTGLGGTVNGLPRETGFDITAASEVMAVLALSRDLDDLRRRLGAIVVGFDRKGEPVTAESLHAAGAMAALMRTAARPNLMQTSEGTPVLVHAGPFANLAVGNSSIVADRIALPRVDYLVTEGGFGADLGGEKFFHLKCATSGLPPSAAVLVATVRALKRHVPRAADEGEDVRAVEQGSANMRRHIAVLRGFGVPVVVAVNRFPSDTPAELDALRASAIDAGAIAVAPHEGFARGGDGAVELAEAIEAACDASTGTWTPYYTPEMRAEEKVAKLAQRIYGAAEVRWEPAAKRSLEKIRNAGYGHLPVCVAKTHLSFSHDPSLLGAPSGFTFPVRDVRLYAGAGFLTILAGEIMTMPGMPSDARFSHIDLDTQGEVIGLA